jgi:hypothetical protein
LKEKRNKVLRSLISNFSFRIPNSAIRYLKLKNLLLFFISLLLLLSASFLQAMPPVQRTILPNGLVLLISEDHSLPFVTLQLLIDSGSWRDPPGEEGLSHLTARGLLLGTSKYTVNALNEELDFMGASLNSSSSRDYATISLRVLKKDLDKGLDLLIEVLAQPAFPEDEIQREVEKILASIQSSEDQPEEVAEKALAQWGQQTGEVCTVKRAPRPRYELWKKLGVIPRGIDREIVEIMHRTHMGVDQHYENIVEQCTRAALADGWGGSMIATDLQDVLFGCPYPLKSSANLGVLKKDHVNIIIHGHEPLLSEMIVQAAELPEMVALAKENGAKGIQLAGICCTANEILIRHGVPLAGNYLQQELAIITGAVEAMVVDVQCIMENVANVAGCFHTKIITTNPRARIASGKTIHIEFDEHTAAQLKALEIYKLDLGKIYGREVSFNFSGREWARKRDLGRGVEENYAERFSEIWDLGIRIDENGGERQSITVENIYGYVVAEGEHYDIHLLSLKVAKADHEKRAAAGRSPNLKQGIN